MKKFTIFILTFMLSLASVNADYQLISEKVGDSVKVTVTSDFWGELISEGAIHLGYDVTSLNVTNLTNGNVLSTADILTSWESGITYVWHSNESVDSNWELFSFLLSKNENASGNDFSIDITDGNAVLDSWEVSTTSNSIKLNLDGAPVASPVKQSIIAQWKTNIKTWSTSNMIFLLSLLLILGIVAIKLNKKES